MYEAQKLNVQRSWNTVEQKVEAALDASPDKAWASDAAARLYGRRALAAGDRRAYERGVALARAARAANPFDPYIVLRRAELDLDAMGRGLLTGVTDEGRDSLDAAKSMTPDSTLVRKVETALLRRGGRILWIEPQASAGFGPAGSLVVAGSAPGALAGTHVFLHWRDATRDAGWTTESNAPVPDAEGGWYNAIPNAEPRHRYEVYATCETWSYGPCIYAGTGAIQLCSPLAMIGPRPAGAEPAGSLFVGGTAPDAAAAADLFLHWRNATRPSSWAVRPFRSTGAGEGVSFPADAPGNWYAVIPERPARREVPGLPRLPDRDAASPARMRGTDVRRSVRPSPGSSRRRRRGSGRREASSWPVPCRRSGRGRPYFSTGGTSRPVPRGPRKPSRRRPMPGATGPTPFRTPTPSPGTRSRSPHRRRPRTAAPTAGTAPATSVPDRAQPLAAGSSFEVIWYRNASGSNGSSRPSAVSPCGYMK